MYEWVHQVSEAIASLDEAPQFGMADSFPLPQLQEKLSALFDLPELTLDHQDRGWTTPPPLEDAIPLAIHFAPLETPLYFTLSEQDMRTLLIALFHGEAAAAPFLDKEHVDGFIHFLALEILEAIDGLDIAKGLTPRLGSVKKLPEGPVFVSDISLTMGKQALWGRLLVPDLFRKEWKRHFATLPPPSLSEEAARKLSVDISLEVGKSDLSWAEWKGVKAGDFILLDHGSYDPDSRKGRLILTLGDKPLFRGKLSNEGLKLLEYPLYEEVSAMDEEHEPNEEDEDLYGDVTEEETVSTEAAPPEEGPALTPETLPIQLTVEVGRLRMTAQELLNLSPGNLLELPVAPEQGVDLVINGKRVGKGELIKMGEVLGVRVLKL